MTNSISKLSIFLIFLFSVEVGADTDYLFPEEDIARLIHTDIDINGLRINTHNIIMDEAPELRANSKDVLAYVKNNFTYEYIRNHYSNIYKSNYTPEELNNILKHLNSIPDLENYFRTQEGWQLKAMLGGGWGPFKFSSIQTLWIQEHGGIIIGQYK
jgi:hypothetical protein